MQGLEKIFCLLVSVSLQREQESSDFPRIRFLPPLSSFVLFPIHFPSFVRLLSRSQGGEVVQSLQCSLCTALRCAVFWCPVHVFSAHTNTQTLDTTAGAKMTIGCSGLLEKKGNDECELTRLWQLSRHTYSYSDERGRSKKNWMGQFREWGLSCFELSDGERR